MWMPWIALAAASDPRGFEPVREVDGCAVSMRPEGHPDGAAMRAECVWPEIAPDAVRALVTDYPRYTEFVYPITESRIVRQPADGPTLLFQRHEIFGIADREVLLWMTREELEDGGVRVSWTTASEQPLLVTSGAVRTPRNEGYWEVAPAPTGGSRVVHEIALDAGGSVPRWLVALVRTRGFARVLEDLRRVAGEAP